MPRKKSKKSRVVDDDVTLDGLDLEEAPSPSEITMDGRGGVEEAEFLRVPIEDVEANPWNPNEMDDPTFNMLVENLTGVGMNQPVFVTPKRDEEGNIIKGKYRIIDGEQRYQALRLSDATHIPCMVKEEIDEDEQKFQTLRMNRLKGNLNKAKFQEMVTGLMEKGFTVPELADKMGFTAEDDFRAMIDDVSKGLSGKMKQEFDKVRDEIKTVDHLTVVLNRLFSQYGSTLPYNYMVFDFGGKDHLWLRISDGKSRREFKLFKKRFELCMEHKVTVDSVVMLLIQRGMSEKFITQFRKDLTDIEEDAEPDPLNQDFLDSIEELEDE